jgi:2-polyprenyl-6-methoxyphenol hydroxylase-like FAD-dependent oxidoreductase
MTETHDVVVVGAGIGGAALATVLARKGLDVLVLEQQTAYRDKVRGEWMAPWGVAETMRLGLDEVLIGAGGGYGTRIVNYDETSTPDTAEASAIALDTLLPGVPGSLNVGHPEACEALAQAALRTGAQVVRGVGDVAVSAGLRPEVRYELDDVEQHVRCRLIVGADGRSSSVRRQVGIELQETVPQVLAAGLLVRGLREWPSHIEAIGTEGDVHYLIFARPGGFARLYIGWDIADKRRFTGVNRVADFLGALHLNCLPGCEEFVAAQPAGPCASYPMNDAWCDTPFTDGVVLIGDAAGWSDPIIGQGLSIAMRDARIVSDVLLADSNWTPAAFVPYAEERAERLRRLRVSVRLVSALRCTFTPQAAARRAWHNELSLQDSLAAAPVVATLSGPETVPSEAFEPGNIERILSRN